MKLKKLIAGVSALALALTTLGISAYAEDKQVAYAGVPVYYEDFSTAISQCPDNGAVELLTDIPNESDEQYEARVWPRVYTDLSKAISEATSGETVELCDDVDLNNVTWSPVALAKGVTFDGNGKTISNLTISSTSSYVGLFSTVGGKVENLTIDKSNVTGGERAGILTGDLQDNGGVICNVTVSNSYLTGGKYTGAIVGYDHGDVSNCSVIDCNITGIDQVGGIAGYQWIDGLSNLTVSGGSITATEERAGGILGKYQMSTGNDKFFRFNKCVVENVTITAPDYAGGLIAQVMGDTSSIELKDSIVSNVTLVAPQTNYLWNMRDEEQPECFRNAVASAITDSSNTFPPVAEIEGDSTPYYSLKDAVAAAPTKATIKLLEGIDVYVSDQQISIPAGKDITLNLNGKQITCEKPIEEPIIVDNGASLTIEGNGRIFSRDMLAVKLTRSGAYNDNPTHDAMTALAANETAKLVINDGTYTGTDYAISGNGNRHDTAVTINGGTFKALEGTAIYLPQYGDLTVNGGTFTGNDAAIEIRSGNLTINDGTFTSQATAYSCNPNGNGTTTSGAAVAIAQHTTKNAINVAINGGEFEGVKSVDMSNPQSNTDPSGDVNATIAGGYFKGEVDCSKSSNPVIKAEISGGYYTVAPSEDYLASGYIVKDNTDTTYKFTVGLENPVAKDETTGKDYSDVATALEDAAANTSKVVTIAENVVTTLTDATAYAGATVKLESGAKLISDEVFLKDLGSDKYEIVKATNGVVGTYIQQLADSKYNKIEVKGNVVPKTVSTDGVTGLYETDIQMTEKCAVYNIYAEEYDTTTKLYVTDLPEITGANAILGILVNNIKDGKTVTITEANE